MGFDSSVQGGARSTFLVYPIARVGRSLEYDRLRVLIFGVISIVKLDGLGLAGDRPSIIPGACGNILRGLKSDILGKATA
ncbi:hypothetical protein D0A34_01250 [Microcoleus vaginatus PCC 9802]|nr:hypothetical protein D0A34_01250 [Microcoleus vaginatus PCC 9802]